MDEEGIRWNIGCRIENRLEWTRDKGNEKRAK